MITILEQYLVNIDNEGSIETLNEQSDALKEKIEKIKNKIQSIDLRSVSESEGMDRRQEIRKILLTPQQYLWDEKKALQSQGYELNLLSNYLEVYMEPVGKQPRELEQKIKKLQNLQSLSQSKGCSQSQRLLLAQWTNQIIRNQQKKLKQLVSAYPTHLRVQARQIEIYKDLLNQQICREFVKVLYKNLFIYDVPSFSYVLQSIVSIKTQKDCVNALRQSIVFTSDNSQKYYETLFSAIERVRELLQILKTSFQKQENLKSEIERQKVIEEENLKAQIEYILPYLSLPKRKQLIMCFDNLSLSDVSLFDILVRFRVKGQDGEILSGNVEALSKKIRNQPSQIQHVIAFLQICQTQEKSLQMAFYVSEELVNCLQDCISFQAFTQLLAIRQSIRFRIHHPN